MIRVFLQFRLLLNSILILKILIITYFLLLALLFVIIIFENEFIEGIILNFLKLLFN